jgi:hypothetical protein
MTAVIFCLPKQETVNNLGDAPAQLTQVGAHRRQTSLRL